MALSLKLDTENLPGLVSLLGLGGMPREAMQAGESAPADSTAQPATQTEGNVNPGVGEVLPPAKTKIQTLKDFISPGPDALVAATQGDTSGIAEPSAQPVMRRDMSAIPDVGEGAPQVAVKQTWKQRHPLASTLLRVALDATQGGLIGSQYDNAGKGFQAAQQAVDPIRKEMEAAALAKSKADVAHQQAQTEQMKTQVTLPNGLTVPWALAQKLYPTLITEQGKDTRQQKSLDSKEAIALRNKGLKIDEATGKQVPIPYEELSPTEQAAVDLKKSQIGATQARADLARYQADPNNPKVQIARELLKIHAQTAATAAARLGLDQKRYLADYLGTDENGNPLPGVALTDNGTPQGVKITNATKPTNATRSKAEQAGVIKQQGEDLIKQIDAHPELFGVVAGRWNDFNAGQFGDASPEVRDAYTSLKSFASLQPALHGSRGIGMQKEFEDALGTMKQNPEALKASVRSLLRTAASFQKAGTVRTAPGNSPKAVPAGASYEVYSPDGKTLIGHVVNGKYVAGK